MKKTTVYIITLLLLSACAPSEQAIQEAIAKTQTAAPTSVVEQTIPAPSQPTEFVPSNTDTPSPVIAAESCSGVNGTELLSEPWHLEAENAGAELYQEIDPSILQGKTTLLITYDLHG